MEDKTKNANTTASTPTKEDTDRHLDVPAEANRDNHINFAALENGDEDPADQTAIGKFAEKIFSDKDNEKE